MTTRLRCAPQDAVILDVDGTLCDVRSVQHRGRSADDWHRETLHCPPNPAVISAACEAHAAGRTLLIVTHRQKRYAGLTVLWLAKHLPVPFAAIYMRDAHDHRSGAIVKRELLELIRADGYRVVHAYDDDPTVLEVWRSEGVPATRVDRFGGCSGPVQPSP